ncbi:DNA cytosine methyltransferase [Bradyrhizobium sp. SZCCHNR1015]|uniref:DNA cytosine methyltransferase n=1 Tax=Bradyrhizobium sp. SZCCHNR1015 TaxID=3057338 RepID=UPI002916FD7E|nr:DNA cytosine methyltransferase [Bradyrhizobium sp. SZCCHNR1015]
MVLSSRRRTEGLSKKPKAIDLFSGCGGLTLGLRQAGFSVIGAIEADAVAAHTYRQNHRNSRLWQADIVSVSPAQMRKILKLKVGELDLLAGCPPCQGFSSLRTRNGAQRNRDLRNGLVSQMVRFARVLRPKFIMMENVPNLASREPFRQLCRDLKRIGYRVEYAVKDASRYGVPQRRKRLILLASIDSAIVFAPEEAEFLTVRDAIGTIPSAGSGADPLHDMPEFPRSARINELIRDIPKDGGSRRDLPAKRQLDCHRKTTGFSDIYGRMAWDQVAPTITTGCFNPSKGRFLHPEEDRAITMREAALLQGFPATYRFDPRLGKIAIAKMIGNALPPEFIRRHAILIRSALQLAD